MRLMHVDTLKFHEFFGLDDTPSYYILSHRWERGEVSYKEVVKNRTENSPGWDKVSNFCRFVKLDHVRRLVLELTGEWEVNYVWVDTCSIDKRHTAELSEAINSMYKWYERAVACFAFLNDVPAGGDETTIAESMNRSVWFTRAWTLQELIAPSHVIFVDREWSRALGHKGSLARLIFDITGIDEDFLRGDRVLKYTCIAEKMAWAAQRVCSRSEDIVYSLMGIFDVNMPLIYGEGGEKAFIRLQKRFWLCPRSTRLCPPGTASTTMTRLGCWHHDLLAIVVVGLSDHSIVLN